MAGSEDTRAHIFALDDDELWLRSYVRLFAQRGGRVTTFTRPEDALSAIERDRFALGMIDYHLGGGWTGAMFAQQAQARLGRSTPPLLLISGQLEQVSDAERKLFMGAYPKSTPPMSIVDEVFATIAEVAKRSPSSHSQLRAMRGPVGRKRMNTPK